MNPTAAFSPASPSGIVATLTSAYDVHRSSFLRLEGTDAYAEMDPAFGYHGTKLRFGKLGEDKKETEIHPTLPDKDQFALELDHFSECITTNRQPRTPGEEGLQGQRIMEAIYNSAGTGKSVRIAQLTMPIRGPELPPMES